MEIDKKIKNLQAPWSQNINRFTLKKFIGFIKPINRVMRKNIILSICVFVVTALDAFLFSIVPKFINQLLNAVLSESHTSSMFGIELKWQQWVLVIGVLYVIICILEFFSNYSAYLLSVKIEINLRITALTSLVRQDISFYRNSQLGSILTRLLADTQNVGSGVETFMANSIYCLTCLISTLGMLFFIDVQLAYMILIYMVFVVSSAVLAFVFFRRATVRAMDIKREIDTDVTDRLMNFNLIKANGTEDYEGQNMRRIHKYYDKALGTKVTWNTWLVVASSTLTSFLGVLSIVLAIIFYNDNPNYVISTGVAFSTSVLALEFPISLINVTLRGATKASNSAMRLEQIIDPKPAFERNEGVGIKVNRIESVVFKNLVFSYPDSPKKIILNNLNIEFERGKSYAFVGTTGSGKSTIARLLLRSYDPVKGQVLINGIDLKQLDLPYYLQKVGYVEQEPQILYGNFMYNLRYGTFGATDEQVYEAAKKASLHDFIMSLPNKYDTILGERGFMLSGGQKQRLVIARMFLKNPEILILDEATSALDNIVEYKVQQQLNELIKGRTSFSIAHRLQTIKDVDQIIVLSREGIEQQGTFDELKESPGHFRDLYNSGLLN